MRSAVGLALVLTACSRIHPPPSDAGSDAHAEADAAPSSLDAAVPVPLDSEEPPPPTFLEARRSHLSTLDDEPGLAHNERAILTHFDGGLPPAMELQAASLGSGRQALLLSAASAEPNPIAFLVDAVGTAIWTKNRPLGGLSPPARPFAIAPRQDEGVALFFYDEPAKLVGARMWALDGSAFSEVMLFSIPRCDAISTVWWPGQGWILVTAFPGGARAQLLTEEGMSAWGAQGIAVGEAWRAAAPATIVIEPNTSSWLLVQRATRGGADHAIAIEYGTFGQRTSAGARDLGPIARTPGGSDRIAVSLVRPGLARVELGAKAVDLVVDSPR